MRDPVVDPRTIARVPDPLAQIAMKQLEKEPGARFQTATELRNALVSAGAAMPPTRPPAIGTSETVAAGQGPVSGYGATAYVTGGPTTNSGAAAQAITKPPPLAPAKKKAGLWVAVGLVVAAGAGAAAFLATRGGSKNDAAPQTAQVTPAQAPAPVMPAPPPVPPPSPPAPSPSQPVAAPPPLEPCATGQVRTDDTQGHCCWPDQAWSSAHDRCVGKPSCPKGLAARGETCSEPIIAASTLSPEMFSVAPMSAKAGDSVTLRFPAPLDAKSGEQYWAAIVAVGKPDSEWGVWAYVPQHARKLSLKAPAAPGAYEVRLHGNYPTRSYNVVHRVRITVE
jgi:hypothetical protein